MNPKVLIQNWVELFNQHDFQNLAKLYCKEAVIHQTPTGFIEGQSNIKSMFKDEFEQFDMVCIIENIFEDNNVGILEWKDPKGLRGCTLFWIENDTITYQRGYWDKLSFMGQQNN